MAGFFGLVLFKNRADLCFCSEEKFLISQYDTLNCTQKAINVAKMFAN